MSHPEENGFEAFFDPFIDELKKCDCSDGGIACIRHYVLRSRLRRAGSIPKHYTHFLDAAAEHIILRKVGGGYIFLHRLLLDYFANLENEPISSALAEGRQEEILSHMIPSLGGPIGADTQADEPTTPSVLASSLPEGPRLLLCGHEQRTPNARFCSVCGAPTLFL